MKKSFKNSTKNFYRSQKFIPMATQTFSKSALQWPLGAAPMFFETAKGCIIKDLDNNSYIDFILGLLPVILGYQDRDVDKAVRNQMKKGVLFSMSHPIETELAEELINIIPYAQMVRFGKSGSDVLSAAVRLARAYTKKDMVLVSGYHGWHDWFIGSTNRNKGVPLVVQKLTKSFIMNDLEDFNKKIKKHKNKIAAVVIEPEGTFSASKEFLKEIKKICTHQGIVLIFDEIICGFRSSLGGVSEKLNVFPDLGCFGKSMANGYPISALVGKKKIMKLMNDIFFSGTFAGETISMAASLATIKKLKNENIPNKINELGNYLKKECNKLIIKSGIEDIICITGNDWWPRLVIKKNSNFMLHLFRQEAINNGLFMGSGFNLCLAHNTSKIKKQTLKAFQNTLNDIKAILNSAKPETKLRGKRLKGIFEVR